MYVDEMMPTAFSGPAGWNTDETEKETLRDIVCRLPFDLCHFFNGLRGEFRRAQVDQNVSAGFLQADNLAVDRGV